MKTARATTAVTLCFDGKIVLSEYLVCDPCAADLVVLPLPLGRDPDGPEQALIHVSPVPPDLQGEACRLCLNARRRSARLKKRMASLEATSDPDPVV